MVCYGPSKGCRNCRARKIKCDEKRPTCGQCAKSKKICPGYDRGNGVAFRDETRSVEKRATRDRRPDFVGDFNAQNGDFSPASVGRRISIEDSRATTDEPSPIDPLLASSSRPAPVGSFIEFNATNVTAGVSSRVSRTAPTPGFIDIPGYNNATAKNKTAVAFPAIDFVPPGLAQDPEQQSVCFFMTKFVQEDRQEEIWGGSLEVLPSIYNKSGANSALSLATAATAISSVSWNPECAHFKSVSLSKYVKSLKALNDIIQDPEESKTDNVLMAVLMLGFYENIKGLTLQKSAREAHTRGAVALIKARSQQSFHSKTSLRLFLAVRAQLVAHCIQNSDPYPLDDFLAATTEAVPEDFVPSCADRLVLLAMDIPRLRLREQNLLVEADPEVRRSLAADLLKDAKQVDRTVASWSLSLPAEFFYSSLPLNSSSASKAHDVYPASMDIYHDTKVSSTWNSWRTTRIHILRIIMECASVLQPQVDGQDPSPDHLKALTMIQQLVDQVCSSIPFHLGHHLKKVSSPGFSDYPHSPGAAKWPENFAASGAVGGWLMMPPLAFVSRLECIPCSQRAWMLEYLTTFMRDPRDMNRGLSTVDDLIYDRRLRILLEQSRASEETRYKNMTTHPVRRYYQVRAALSAELSRYQASDRPAVH